MLLGLKVSTDFNDKGLFWDLQDKPCPEEFFFWFLIHLSRRLPFVHCTKDISIQKTFRKNFKSQKCSLFPDMNVTGRFFLHFHLKNSSGGEIYCHSHLLMKGYWREKQLWMSQSLSPEPNPTPLKGMWRESIINEIGHP